jgi:glycosyltransferase involved in cell wall biosynthesis
LPRISVIIPAFNASAFLRPCLDSVMEQTYRDFETIVVDDGSTDDTAEVVSAYGSRVRYVHKANGGTSSALNAGIQIANGEYLAWLSADDAFLPTKLERQLDQLTSDPTLKISHTAFHIIDSGGTLQKTFVLPANMVASFSPLSLIKFNMINGSSILFHRECLASTGGFDESIQGTEDWDMWIRMSCFFAFGYIAEPLMLYRWHEGNFSHRRQRINGAAWKMIRKTLAYPPFLEHARAERGWKSGEMFVHRLCDEIADAYLYHPVHVDLIARLLWRSVLVGPRHVSHYAQVTRLARRCVEARCDRRMDLGCQSRVSRILLRGASFLARPDLLKRVKRRLLMGAVEGAKAMDRDRRVKHSGEHEDRRHGPLVSVIVPTYNRPETLAEALQSIVTQTYSSIEVIVVNDGGRDVRNVILRYASQRDIRYIHLLDNKGRSAARNIGIAAAQGQYLAYLDDDDLFYPEHLTTLVNYLEVSGRQVAYTDAFKAYQQKREGVLCNLRTIRSRSSVKLALLYGLTLFLPRRAFVWLNEAMMRWWPRGQQSILSLNESALDMFSRAEGRYLVVERDIQYQRDFTFQDMLRGNFIPILCMTHLKSCLDEVGTFDESLSTHEDWDLWIRMGKKFEFTHLSKVTCEFAWRDDQTTTTSRQQEEMDRTWRLVYDRYAYLRDEGRGGAN